MFGNALSVEDFQRFKKSLEEYLEEICETLGGRFHEVERQVEQLKNALQEKEEAEPYIEGQATLHLLDRDGSIFCVYRIDKYRVNKDGTIHCNVVCATDEAEVKGFRHVNWPFWRVRPASPHD